MCETLCFDGGEIIVNKKQQSEIKTIVNKIQEIFRPSIKRSRKHGSRRYHKNFICY
jgi:23S rRNA maturation mini-RNase III